MNLRKYFSFKGRINRAKYFFIPLIITIITCTLQIMYTSTASVALALSLCILYLLIAIPSVIVEVCIIIQRLHDIERPGTHIWLLFIPLYNIYLGLLLLFKKGTDGPNAYGEDPLAVVYE